MQKQWVYACELFEAGYTIQDQIELIKNGLPAYDFKYRQVIQLVGSRHSPEATGGKIYLRDIGYDGFSYTPTAIRDRYNFTWDEAQDIVINLQYKIADVIRYLEKAELIVPATLRPVSAPEVEADAKKVHLFEEQVENPAAQLPADVKKKRKHTRGDIKQEDAAAMCGVSVRLIQKWLAGENTPKGFPGLFDTVALGMWAEAYKRQKEAKKIATQMNRAVPVDPKIIEKCHSNSAFMDTSEEDDSRSLEDLIEEQRRDQDQDKRRAKRA